MEFTDKRVTIEELTKGYENLGYEGAFSCNGKLNIRPSYQREFVYKDTPRNAVIRSILEGKPINSMYWALNEDGSWEKIDGQQRTISICEYVAGNFSVDYKYFHNLPEEEQEKFLKYAIIVYICSGTESEKLEWFETINIAGEKLTAQELRNAAYTGSWLSDAKRYFSKNNCLAYQKASKLLKGSPIRQDYLESVIKWISSKNIEQYMADNQHRSNAKELWRYFEDVIDWVNSTFPKYRKEMKGLEWGLLYNEYRHVSVDPEDVTRLMMDEEIEKKSGIYQYLLSGEEKWLNLRSFSDNQKREAFERQQGRCARTGKQFDDYTEMHADHVIPWSKGGKTDDDNLEMVCPKYNLTKSNK